MRYRSPLGFVALLVLITSLAQAQQWEPVGPGYFTPIGFAEGDGFTFFAAARGSNANTTGGHVYRSADGGRSWTNITGSMINTTQPVGPKVTAIGANDGLVIIATRESFNEGHLYLSTDAGVTWTQRTTLPTIYEGIDALYVLNANTIVAYGGTTSSQAQVMSSTDGGATWTVHPETFTAGTPAPKMAGGRLYFPRTETVNRPGGGFDFNLGAYVSEDLGATWTAQYHTTTNANTAINATWTDGDRFYEYIGGFNGHTFYWTNDGGQTWETRTLDLSTVPALQQLQRFAQRDGQLTVQGFERSRPRPPNGTDIVDDYVMAASLDAGQTWMMGDADDVIQRSTDSGFLDGILYASSGGFLFTHFGSNTLGTGVYFSPNGLDWSPARGIEGFYTQMGHSVVFEGAIHVLENNGSPTGGGLHRSTTGDAWRFLSHLAAGSRNNEGCADRSAHGTAAVLDSVIVSVCEDGKVLRSRDGLTFREVGTAPTDRPKRLESDGGVLYLMDWASSLGNTGGQRATVYTSSDAGETWETRANNLRLLSRPSVVNGRMIFIETAAFGGSNASYSTDGGATFTTYRLPMGGSLVGATATVDAFFVSGVTKGGFFASQGFYRSRDDGQTWDDLLADGSLTDAPASLHTIGPNSNTLVAVFSDSVGVSVDQGETWQSLAMGWPTSRNPAERQGEDAFVFGEHLYVQVFGGELWRAPRTAFGGVIVANETEAPQTTLMLEAWPNPVAAQAQIRFGVSHAAQATLEVFDLLGRRVAALHEGVLPGGAHQHTLDTTTWPTGLYLVRLHTQQGETLTRRLTVVR
ncbi:MAG: hypothetical protein RhofKO_03760 [Rhodothermales bacterium]